MSRTIYIWPCALMLILSGALGVYKWPPPTLHAYTTLIDATGIGGPEGGLVRALCGVVALCAWALPWHYLRYAGYWLATLSALLLTLSFLDTHEGFVAGSWLSATVWGALALYDEGRRR